MRKAYVVTAKRGAIGSSMGRLTNMPLVDLEAAVLSGTIEEADVNPTNIDEVIVGNVIMADLDQNIGRRVSIKAGVPVEVCAQSLDMLRSSGLKAVMGTTMRIQCGFGGIFIAGGMEFMTNASYLVPSKVRNGTKVGDMKMVDPMLHNRLVGGMYEIHMGVIADNMTKKYSISHEDQDAFAYASQQKAIAVIDFGRLQGEIVPVEIPGRKGSVTVFDTDEHPNHAPMPEKLAKLRPAFTKDGTVTAGNTSSINGGVSFTIIASEDAAKKHNPTPLAEVIGIGQGGVDPRVMGLGPTPAILHVLRCADLCIEDMGLVELNEVFAAQPLGVIHELEEVTGTGRNAFIEKTNVNNGAIALGHPVGASGNRILVSLLHKMQKRDLKIGPISLCIDGGQDATVIIKRV